MQIKEKQVPNKQVSKSVVLRNNKFKVVRSQPVAIVDELGIICQWSNVLILTFYF
jgi:hypothetical protein